MKFFDSNALWGNWQFQGIFKQAPEELENSLCEKGVERALVRLSDAALCPDIEKCNSMLFEAFEKSKRITPVPTLNLKMSDWKTQLEKFSEPAINLYPGCHGCSLLSEETGKLSEIIQKENKTLIVTIRIEDSRASNPYCRFPEVSIEEIKQFLKIFPKIKIIFLNACWGEIKEIAETENDNFLADIAFAERLETLDTLLELISPKQLIFGSNTPLFYIESAKAKILRASSSEEIKNRIAYKNLMELFNEKA